MVTLLPPGYPVSKGKKTLFVFLLEILDGNSIKAEVFWHAKKKHSQASREVQARTTAPTSVPAPSVPPLAPATSPAPSAPVTMHTVPFTLPRVTPTPSLDDVAMPNLCSPPAAEPPTDWPRSGPRRVSNQAFSCKFPCQAPNSYDTPHEVRMARQTAIWDKRKDWLAKAHRRGYNMGQVCNAVRNAGLGDMIPTDVFTTLLRNHFLNLPPGPSGLAPGSHPGSTAL